ncbi:hypothetical protein F511_37651 [Dorcoceras hygrometricum]|uniref:Dystroglycan-like n=1 Tax=Dorcoceras hygrometricum TaxID=472368 RepID=A0A2Z7A465_9LAMI|nr:hypothetical protein F511_37651 [Dorcoceras hygrometricum]
MASSLFTSTLHISFDSVLTMDHEGMVARFEELVATGLKDFLGCPGVIYEDELIEFFQNGSVRDGMVVSTVNGKIVEISKELFAETFQLPVEGLTDMNDVQKDVVFDARSVFLYDGTQIETSGKKRKMKFEFRLLNDILAKSVTVKAGSFDAVTLERFLLMAAINGVGSRQAKGFAIQISLLLEDVPNLELGDSLEFPSSRILTERTVHSCKEEEDLKEQVGVLKSNLDILPVAQEAVPLQTVAPTMEDEPVVESIAEEVRTTSADDMDIIIEQVIAETAQLEMDEGEPDVSKTDVGAQETHRADEMDQWFNLSYEELYAADRPVETESDTDEDIETVDFGTAVGDQQLQTLAENERSADASAVYIAIEPVDEVEAADEQSSIVNIFQQLDIHFCSQHISAVGYSRQKQEFKQLGIYFRRVHLERGSVIGCLQKACNIKSSSGTFLKRKKGRLVESIPAFEFRRPNVTSWGWSQLGTASVRYCLYVNLSTVDISNILSVIVQDRSVATVFDSVIQSSPVLLLTDSSSVFANEDDQMDMDHRSDSPDLSHDSSMHFVEDDIHFEDDSALDQFILPSSATAISASLAALRESFSNLVANQSRDFQKTSDAHSEVM